MGAVCRRASAYKSSMRAPSSLFVSLLLAPVATACSDDGGGTSGLSAAPTTTAPASTSSGTTAAPTSSGSSGPGSTSDAETTSSSGTTAVATTEALTSTVTGDDTTGPDTGSTTSDPECPPVKGEYNDCTEDGGKVDNTLCKWMGTGENGFITCLNAAGLEGASTCSLVGCEKDCHCFNAPRTGTAKSVCRPMATDKGDNACVLDCSGGATCPDGMACSGDTCFWPAP